jgi:hypothetical protein
MRPLHPRALLTVPLLTYALAYLVLACYHGRVWLGNTVVHESGKFTWLQTVFYASHFLGHLPSLTVIGCLLVAALRLWQDPDSHSLSCSHASYGLAIAGFLIGSVVLSLLLFGPDNTLSYFSQSRQSEVRLEPGGSWLLHVPSTILLAPFLVVYAFVVVWLVTGVFPRLRRADYRLYGVALGIFIIATLLAVPAPLRTLPAIWTDPRYLAHSVRELATFPLTFFPLPFYFLFRTRPLRPPGTASSSAGFPLLITCALIFLAGFAYQVVASLHAGVGELAQHPAFAPPTGLPVSYLLAAHYFEHVLDTIYFTLLCLFLLAPTRSARS